MRDILGKPSPSGMRLILLLCLCLAAAVTASHGQAARFTPKGLTYVWWQFDTPEFEDLRIDFTIVNDLPEKPGMYLQFYQGHIGDAGFYFGLQTDVHHPGKGGQGKGILFSRWGTRDLADTRAVSGGWTQSSGHEGDFVGVRRKYAWTNHRYRFRLTRVDEDADGVWYGLFILDYDTGEEDYAGALRFPKGGKIKDGGGTWTEVYSGAQGPADVPSGHIILSGASVDNGKTEARHAVSSYSEVENTDIFHAPAKNEIHMLFGDGVTREHDKGRLF